MKLSQISESSIHIFIKSLDSADSEVLVTPGYCWSMDGADKVFGGVTASTWPYRGSGMYAFAANVRNLSKWPFRWSWSDGKGFTGAPEVVYDRKSIRAFVEGAPEVDDLSRMELQLFGRRRDPKVIARDLVKSVKPGVIVDHDSTYTGNFEIIVNVPIRMYLVNTGEYEEKLGLKLKQSKYARLMAYNLSRKPSL